MEFQLPECSKSPKVIPREGVERGSSGVARVVVVVGNEIVIPREGVER